MGRRSELQIIMDILFEALEASSKTKILHRANLNMESFAKYFQMLEDGGLIERLRDPQKKHPKFRTTENGRTALQRSKELQEMIKGKTMKPDNWSDNAMRVRAEKSLRK
jgi:predicted transcriptional regulator